jgi:hypothetical protein
VGINRFQLIATHNLAHRVGIVYGSARCFSTAAPAAALLLPLLLEFDGLLLGAFPVPLDRHGEIVDAPAARRRRFDTATGANLLLAVVHAVAVRVPGHPDRERTLMYQRVDHVPLPGCTP